MPWDSWRMKNPEDHLDYDQIKRLIRSANSWRDSLLIKVLAYTGRRISEVVRNKGKYGLKPNMIDFKEDIIYWKIAKKKKEETHPIPAKPELIEELGKYIDSRRIRPNQFVFDISRRRVDQILKKLGKKTGIKTKAGNELHAHCFRHSFAIRLAKNAESPADLRKIQKFLAHSDLRTTEFYLRFAPESMKKMLEEL